MIHRCVTLWKNIAVKLMHKKYDFIYSIGADCASAMYMRKFYLRRASGPFDWLCHADFKTRIEMILTKFDGFLLSENMVMLPRNTTGLHDAINDSWHDTKTGFYFYHDFEHSKDFAETFPLVREKYNRRIARFYDNIEKYNRVLLIWYSQSYNTPDDVILGVCDKVCKKFNKQIDFIIIENDESMPRNKIETRQIADNIIRHAVYAIDETTPTLGNYKLIDKIFSKIRIRGKTASIIRARAIKIFTHIFCCFIPSRESRHRLKERLSKWIQR